MAVKGNKRAEIAPALYSSKFQTPKQPRVFDQPKSINLKVTCYLHTPWYHVTSGKTVMELQKSFSQRNCRI